MNEDNVSVELHLCSYCSQCFATCKSNPEFGSGKGNDNIYECDAFTQQEDNNE